MKGKKSQDKEKGKTGTEIKGNVTKVINSSDQGPNRKQYQVPHSTMAAFFSRLRKNLRRTLSKQQLAL